MSKLILIRHGQSIWNLQNRFTGWQNVELSKNGIKEAEKAGALIKNLNLNIEAAFTSYLVRAIKTLEIILEICSLEKLKYKKAWELNERHYGSLTGLNKSEIRSKLGEKQFKNYRRSWDIAPPPLDLENGSNPKNDEIYKDLNSLKIPNTESLKDTFCRVVPYFEKYIEPKILDDQNIIVVAHGNSLRALCKRLFNISNKSINKLEIPTGNPLLINIDSQLRVIDRFYLDKSREQKIISDD